MKMEAPAKLSSFRRLLSVPSEGQLNHCPRCKSGTKLQKLGKARNPLGGAMRNVRALCSFAIVAAAFGCGGSNTEEAKAPTEPGTQEPAPPTAVEGQTPQAGAEPGMTEG